MILLNLYNNIKGFFVKIWRQQKLWNNYKDLQWVHWETLILLNLFLKEYTLKNMIVNYFCVFARIHQGFLWNTAKNNHKTSNIVYDMLWHYIKKLKGTILLNFMMNLWIYRFRIHGHLSCWYTQTSICTYIHIHNHICTWEVQREMWTV